MVDVREQIPQLVEAGGRVAAVAMGTPQQVARFFGDLTGRMTCLADPDRQAYKAFGLERAGWWQIAGPQVWLPSIRALLRGGVGRPVGDVQQLPGAFVIDCQGVVRLADRPKNQVDRHGVDELVATVRSLVT